MKNKYIMLLMMLSASFSFVACGGDDDEIGGGSNNNGGTTGGNSTYNKTVQELVKYTWYYFTGTDYMAYGDYDMSEQSDSYTMYFVDDSYGVCHFYHHSYDTSLGLGSRGGDVDFYYTINDDNRISCDYMGSKIASDYHLPKWLEYKNGTLTWQGSDEAFKKNAYDYNDKTFINEWMKTHGSKQGTTGNVSYNYDYKARKLTISGTGRMPDYSENTQPWNGWEVWDLIVEDGVTYIGKYAFCNLTLWNPPTLPETLQEIGDYAFYECGDSNPAGTFKIPNSVVSIGDYAFSKFKWKYIDLCNTQNPNASKLETIGEWAFEGSNLTFTVTLPVNVKTVGDFAFDGTDIKGVGLNEKLESIGNYAFACKLTGDLIIPNSVKYIGAVAFAGSFDKIVIGTGVEKIGGQAFSCARSGVIYINRATPPETDGHPIDEWIIKNWSLHVPNGCKSAYSIDPWIYFGSIVEDASLEGENTNDDNPSDTGETSTTSGKVQGHEYVDLGLSVKWATCNIGANSPEEYGLFFAWGETTGYTAETHEFTRDNYMWYNDATYNTSIFNNNTLSSSYDAAYVNWGTSWRMPTRTEFEQLLNKCTWTNTMQNGVSGFLVKGPNGNSIFLPEGGRHKQTLEYEGTCGDYWTSTYYLANKTGDRAYHVFSFSSSTNRDSGVTYRYYGLNIRPVTK